jgi:putative endonuclease
MCHPDEGRIWNYYPKTNIPTFTSAMETHDYFIYITTNPKKTVLYTEVTNDLVRRLAEHWEDNFNGKKTFAAKYFCYNLIYYETFSDIRYAIEREKEIKGWNRLKRKCLLTA